MSLAPSATGPDVDVPALLVRTGRPAWDYGALATVRTLGRWGIPVLVMAEPSERELLRSKYIAGRVAVPLSPEAPPERSVGVLNAVAETFGGPCVVIAGDDESAVLLAEHRTDIDPRLLTFDVAADLPRRLSDKASLAGVASAVGVEYPRHIVSTSTQDIRRFVDDVGLPVIAKSPEPYARLADSAVPFTRLIRTGTELADIERVAAQGHRVFLQEFLARDGVQFWYTAGVATRAGEEPVVWTGRKVAAHPAETGVGVVNVALPQKQIAARMANACAQIGYVGPFDADWVLDPSNGALHLIDFNPRRGAQFRLFTTTSGLDGVRACHLHLTGRHIDWGEQVFGRVQLVENLSLAQGGRGRPRRYLRDPVAVERSWWAADDISPALAMAGQMLGSAGRKILGTAKGRG